MAVDYEEGRRLFEEARHEHSDWEAQWPLNNLIEFLLTHAEALLNPDPWRPIEELPEHKRTSRDLLLKVPKKSWPGYRLVVGHWACDLSGEEQPPYKGWYCDDGIELMRSLPEPTHFRELKGPGQ